MRDDRKKLYTMKILLTASLIALIATVACTTEVPVTVEVTEEIEVTRLVEVTREVEVTPEIDFDRVPKTSELCIDYPYIVELGELQLGIYQSSLSAGDGATLGTGSLELLRATRDWLDSQLRTSRLNRVLICGLQPEPPTLAAPNTTDPLWAMARRREMKSFEGTGACARTLHVLEQLIAASGSLDNLPATVRNAFTAGFHGYVDYCDNDYPN